MYDNSRSGPGSITLIRHGQSLHNVDRAYAFRDPPLTDNGVSQAKAIRLSMQPDLIIVSPMMRTIETALLAFPDLIGGPAPTVPVLIWPDLREAHDAICNIGVSRAELEAQFPNLDFSECSVDWDYPPTTVADAEARAEQMRIRLRDYSRKYRNIAVLTHRGFLAFLVQGERFGFCETRAYRVLEDKPLKNQRYGIHVDTGEEQDFGPTVLWPLEDPST